MTPVNRPARTVADALAYSTRETSSAHSFEWSAGTVLLVDNWQVLHGRGEMPDGEGRRELIRIYVR